MYIYIDIKGAEGICSTNYIKPSAYKINADLQPKTQLCYMIVLPGRTCRILAAKNLIL